MKPQTLTDIMALGAHKPVGSQGATLALALHCLMVREGFSVVETSPEAAPRRSSYAPPYGWKLKAVNEWEFEYTRDGKANKFTLVVSLHPESGRTFVHGSENGSTTNIQVLGLQLEKYVPDAALCAKAANWDGIMANEDVLTQQFLTHIVYPLIDQSEELSPRMLYNTPKAQPPPSRSMAAWASSFREAAGSTTPAPGSDSSSSVYPYVWAGLVAAAGASMAVYAMKHRWAH